METSKRFGDCCGWSIAYVILAIIFVMMDLASAQAQQYLKERRLALVIGNSDYLTAPDLKNPQNDASAVAAVLENLNFDVSLGLNLDAVTLRKQIQKFVGQLTETTAAVFFYAGHGMQVNGANYLIPVDANLANINDLEFETVRFDLLLTPMEQTAGTSIIFLDACRDNPLADNLARSTKTRSLVGRGLAPIQSGAGLFIGFATQPGNVAADGVGNNSPFTTALLHFLPAPNLDVEMMMRKVRDEVIHVTDKRQVPWSNSSLSNAGFMFNPTVSAEPEQIPEAALGALAPSQGQLELEFWRSIANSGDPSLFESYLRRYPQGNFREIATAKIKNLRKPPAKALKASLDKGDTRDSTKKATSTSKKKATAKPVSKTKTAVAKPRQECREETWEECHQRARRTGKRRGYCRTNRLQICK